MRLPIKLARSSFAAVYDARHLARGGWEVREVVRLKSLALRCAADSTRRNGGWMGEKSICLQYTRRLEPFPNDGCREIGTPTGFADDAIGAGVTKQV